MFVYAYTGENVIIEVEVLDEAGDAADLSNATAKIALLTDTTEQVDCTIATNVITAELGAEYTASPGSIPYEIRLTDGDDIKTVQEGIIYVAQSLFVDTPVS